MKRLGGWILLLGLAFRVWAAPDSLRLDSAQLALLDSMERTFVLEEVVVTAEESTTKSSASVINREAMHHLQPSSFADLVNLLPGATTKDPDLTHANSIHLREANNYSTDDNYAASSLGTGFVIDGAPVSTDANMQYIQGGSSTQDGERQMVNKGVDMRTISTDEIEKVEIIRGVANAEYGEITSGVVKIERSMKPTPWRARFKADGFSKLFHVGKGVAWNAESTVLNVGIDYLSAKNDPTNTLENYRRINASVRLQQRWMVQEYVLRWQSNIDYSGNIDTDKNDPDIHNNREDSYRSEMHKIGWTNTLNWSHRTQTWWNTSLQANVQGEISNIEHTKFIQLTTPIHPILDNMDEGGKDALLLPSKYVANHRVEGRPLSVFIRPKTSFTFHTWTLGHKADVGVEWKYDKNYGAGQLYDMSRPMNYTSNLRPRAYYDIPANNLLAWYVQDDIHIPLCQRSRVNQKMLHSLDMNIGIRGSSLLGLDSRYAMRGTVYIDPRINLSYNIPVGIGFLHIAAAWGIHTKMPTLLQLYPNLLYEDLKAPQQIITSTEQTMNVYTHVINPVNYDLKPARNNKWEVRVGGEMKGHHFALTYFRENMRDGFRQWSDCLAFTYPITENGVTTDYTKLITYPLTTNGSRIFKQGIEWQYQSPRIPVICTRFTINGAWLHTRYENSQAMFSTDKLSQVVAGKAVKDTLMGYYDWEDGSIRENLNTNIIADVYLKKIGLTVSATFELNWYIARQTLRKNGTPIAYMDSKDGKLHPYREVDKVDPYLQYLNFHYNEQIFRRVTVPFAGYLNLRVQKSITKYANIALFVNKLIDYLPDYDEEGITIHRSAGPYFGMEVNLNI